MHSVANRIWKGHVAMGLKENIKKYWELYLMVIPGILFFILFKYVPMLGITIAFKDYGIFTGIKDSPWVGLKHFKAFFEYPDFWRVFNNTMIIGFLKIVLSFPVPIVLSLLLNEVRNLKFKKTVQTVFYIPHFFSWVIIAGLTFDLLSANGVVNSLLGMLGHEPILFMQRTEYFRLIVVLTGIWRDAGWGTIVILAAISGINPSVYEAAKIDGAGRFKQMLNITLPLLVPTLLVLLLLQIGRFLDIGFEHVYNLLTPMTQSVGDTIDTYVYRVGILQGQFSATTAIGVFQSVVGLTLVLAFNKLSKKFSEGGII